MSKTPDPFVVVSQALACSRDSLSIESAMYKTHGWDSFGHVSVIAALEDAYETAIPNEEITSLNTMKAIVDFSQRCADRTR